MGQKHLNWYIEIKILNKSLENSNKQVPTNTQMGREGKGLQAHVWESEEKDTMGLWMERLIESTYMEYLASFSSSINLDFQNILS